MGGGLGALALSFFLDDGEMLAWLGAGAALIGAARVLIGWVRPPVAAPQAPRTAPTAAPAQLTVFHFKRRARALKSADLLLVYVGIVGLFFLVLLAAADLGDARDRLGVALYGIGWIALFAWFAHKRRQGMRQVREWQRIAAQGRDATGEVTRIEAVRWRHRWWTWTPGWIVSYRYRDYAGRSQAGESGYLSRRDAERWRVGDACPLRYDPDAPEKSLWMG